MKCTCSGQVGPKLMTNGWQIRGEPVRRLDCSQVRMRPQAKFSTLTAGKSLSTRSAHAQNVRRPFLARRRILPDTRRPSEWPRPPRSRLAATSSGACRIGQARPPWTMWQGPIWNFSWTALSDDQPWQVTCPIDPDHVTVRCVYMAPFDRSVVRIGRLWRCAIHRPDDRSDCRCPPVWSVSDRTPRAPARRRRGPGSPSARSSWVPYSPVQT
jgi:hypothetical protein